MTADMTTMMLPTKARGESLTLTALLSSYIPKYTTLKEHPDLPAVGSTVVHATDLTRTKNLGFPTPYGGLDILRRIVCLKHLVSMGSIATAYWGTARWMS